MRADNTARVLSPEQTRIQLCVVDYLQRAEAVARQAGLSIAVAIDGVIKPAQDEITAAIVQNNRRES